MSSPDGIGSAIARCMKDEIRPERFTIAMLPDETIVSLWIDNQFCMTFHCDIDELDAIEGHLDTMKWEWGFKLLDSENGHWRYGKVQK